MSKRVLSCIQPTSSEMHLGNYFGAVANWVKLQDEYESFYGVVDYHVLTMPFNPKKLRENSWAMLTNILIAGVDPDKSTLFLQSLVPEHTELCWIFNGLTSFGELSRMTQFKDKSSGLNEDQLISAGLFTYPVLQTADILIYKANYVPVGKDQTQHLEMTRNVANRFNNAYGEFFPEPEALYTETPNIKSFADPTKKMSKSAGPKHYIGIFEEESSIRKKIKSAVTDSGDQQGQGVKMSDGVENLFEVLAACERTEELKKHMDDFNNGTLRYGDLKESVANAVVDMTKGFIERREELTDKKKDIKYKVKEMSANARSIAQETIREVKERTGLVNVKFD